MNKLIYTVLLSCFMAVPAMASSDLEVFNNVKREVEMQQEYCDFNAEKILRYGNRIYLFYSTAGFWSADPEASMIAGSCSMGSGTSLVHLAVLNENAEIIELDTFSRLNINTRFIDTDSAFISAGVLIVRNGEFGRDENGIEDPNSNAGDTYLNKFRLPEVRLIEHKYIGRNLKTTDFME